MPNIGTSLLVIMLCVNFTLAFSGLVDINLLETSFSEEFVDVNYEDGNITSTDDATGNMGLDYNGSSITTNPYSEVSLLSLTWNFLVAIGTFVFAPAAALQALEAPLIVVLILGVVPSFMFIIAIVSFIWRKDF